MISAPQVAVDEMVDGYRKAHSDLVTHTFPLEQSSTALNIRLKILGK